MTQAASQIESSLKSQTSTTYHKPQRAISWKVAKINWLPGFISKRIFGKPMAPTSEEWYAVKDALYQGDPDMDNVVSWMFENGPKESKALFDQALTRGIDTIENPPEPLKAFFAKVDNPPPWLNRELMEEGILASRGAGEVAFYVLRDMALMGGYSYFNTMNQTLALSGALHKDTALRIGETGKWVNDVTEPGGLDRFGPGFISTIRVRMIHALVRRHLQTKDEWQFEKWGIPINQMDMLATYLAFGPVSLSGIKLFGIFPTRSESKAFMHLWRYIGWLSGVDERWLAITEGDGLRKLYHTFLTHNCPDEKIRLMGESLKNEALRRPDPQLDDRYPTLAKWKRIYNYHKHLSNSALIMSPRRKMQLGMPFWTLPWYPLLTFLPRFLTVLYYRKRGGAVLENHLQRNREKQLRMRDMYFGGRKAELIKPDEDHPAHIG